MPAGRPPGAKNKRSLEIAEILAEEGCDPARNLARIVQNNYICRTCDGDGKVKKAIFLQVTGVTDVKELTSAKKSRSLWDCPDCRGTGFERFEHKLIVTANSNLMPFVTPKLSAKTVEKKTQRTVVKQMAEPVDPEERLRRIDEMNEAMRAADEEKVKKRIKDEKEARERGDKQ